MEAGPAGLTGRRDWFANVDDSIEQKWSIDFGSFPAPVPLPCSRRSPVGTSSVCLPEGECRYDKGMPDFVKTAVDCRE